ncbi:acyltransferase [Candidatus Pelagibacter sp.]|nr:acyltransferase [Candidatus Pelagibacter sp.]
MKITYRPEIDGLRAIAVGVVIFYHTQISVFGHQPFQGGFIGVDIFFVISGYLITSIIFKELVTTDSFSFKNFYERRIRRILPVLLVVMLVSIPIAYKFLLPNDIIDFSKSILYSLGFSSNFYFHFSGIDYAVDGLKNPFLHTWSLSVEEQYYILFPIVLLITFKYFRNYLIHTLIVGFVISLALADWGSKNHPSLSFYFLYTRMWELLAGSILAYFEITNGHRSKNKRLNLILPSIGLLLIGYSVLFFNDEMFHPSFYTLSPIVGVCLIIWFSNKDEVITKLLSTKLFVGIGLISYSLYLWHYPFFAFTAKLHLTEGNIYKQLLIFLLIFILSIVSYYFVEKPFRNKNINFKKIILILSIKFFLIFALCVYFINLKFHPILIENKDDHKNFELNYNYNNFDKRKNIFIIGNSYADDLLNLLYYNENLNRNYYFYNAVADEVGSNFQINCLDDFLKKNKKICDKNFFSFLKKQYESSDYIIFHEMFNYKRTYLSSEFAQIVEFLKQDRKKFIVFLDDLRGADVLDIYIHRKGSLPNLKDLQNLEKNLFKKTTNWRKKDISSVKKYFLENNIEFITRSELFCDYNNKRCPLIILNDKLYDDWGHLSDSGAKYFSIKGNQIIQKLINQ